MNFENDYLYYIFNSTKSDTMTLSHRITKTRVQQQQQ